MGLSERNRFNRLASATKRRWGDGVARSVKRVAPYRANPMPKGGCGMGAVQQSSGLFFILSSATIAKALFDKRGAAAAPAKIPRRGALGPARRRASTAGARHSARALRRVSLRARPLDLDVCPDYPGTPVETHCLSLRVRQNTAGSGLVKVLPMRQGRLRLSPTLEGEFVGASGKDSSRAFRRRRPALACASPVGHALCRSLAGAC